MLRELMKCALDERLLEQFLLACPKCRCARLQDMRVLVRDDDRQAVGRFTLCAETPTRRAGCRRSWIEFAPISIRCDVVRGTETTINSVTGGNTDGGYSDLIVAKFARMRLRLNCVRRKVRRSDRREVARVRVTSGTGSTREATQLNEVCSRWRRVEVLSEIRRPSHPTPASYAAQNARGRRQICAAVGSLATTTDPESGEVRSIAARGDQYRGKAESKDAPGDHDGVHGEKFARRWGRASDREGR